MSKDAREIEIEAFRVGSKAARGITVAELDEAIASYNSETDPAPLVFGHPESDNPAHGVIAKVRREGNRLITALKNVSDDAVEGVRKGQFINRSIAFWHPDHQSNPTPGKWNLRHLGLLGAASPGIPGMSKLAFSADESAIESDEAPAAAVVYESGTDFVTIKEGETHVTDKTKDELAAEKAALDTERAALDADKAKFEADQKALKDEKDQIAAAAKASREKANGEYVAGLAKDGKILPPHVPVLTALFNRLPVEEVQFDADTKGTLDAALRGIFDAAKPQIIFEALSPEFGAKIDATSAEGITAQANKMIADAKGKGVTLSFDAAVQAIEERGAK